VKPKKGYPTPQLRKAMAIIEMLDQKKVKNVDAIGHSEGAIVLTLAAKLRPDLFHSIAFFNPAGLSRKRNIGSLVLDAMKKERLKKRSMNRMRKDGSWTEFHQGYDSMIVQEVSKYARSGIRHLIAEPVSIGKTDIGDDVRTLHEEHGINFSIVTGQKDLLMPLPDLDALTERTMIHKISVIPDGEHEHYVLDDRTVTKALIESLTA
jgi:pimeloyl-ACP methyl ester carboxylesterase